MKHLLLLLLLSGTAAQAQLLLNDFDSLSALPYVTADEGAWSPVTTSFASSDVTIGNFGSGSPSGQMGNGFIFWLGGAQDWSSNAYVLLTGFTLPENATPSMNFYIEDQAGNVSISTAFNLTNFVVANTTIALPINFGSVDKTMVAYWGFQVDQAQAPAFGYRFENASVSTAPEPSTNSAIAVGCLGLWAAILKSRKRQRGSV